MAPILIDQRTFFGVAAVIFITMCGLFIGGYVLGYQKAQVHDASVSHTHTLELPPAEQSVAHRSAGFITGQQELSEQYNDHSDQPAAKVQPPAGQQIQEQQLQPQQVRPQRLQQPQTAEKQMPPLVSNKATAKEPMHTRLPAEAAMQTQNVAVKNTAAVIDGDPLHNLSDNADQTSAKYTIQVGLFGSADNAERKIEDLLSKSLSAYSTEFIDQKKQQFYNVRFGYYATYKSAQRALETYQNVLAKEGYIIKLKS